MKNNIILYPTIEKVTGSKIECRTKEISAYYTVNNVSFDLKCRDEEIGKGRFISIVDDSGKWSLDEHNLVLNGTVSITNTASLFGILLPSDGIIGVGLVWRSRSSSLRGAAHIAQINKKSGDVSIKFRKEFPKASLRGNIDISIELYVLSNGNKKGLAVGSTLGEIDSFVLVLEGIGSTFTVFEKSAPGEPLWNVDCEWDDPEFNQFSDCVRVTINTAHPAWISSSDDEVRKELLKEIMASSMQIVISELDPDQYNSAGEYEPGSVSNAIVYFISRAKIDLSSPSSVAKTIRAYLDKSM